MWDGLLDGFYEKYDAIAYVFKNLGTLLKIQLFETINEIIDKFNGISFFGRKLNLSKFDVPVIPSRQEYHEEQERLRGSNGDVNQTNNVTVNIQSSGDSLQDITKAVDKGLNQNKLSPALLVKGM